MKIYFAGYHTSKDVLKLDDDFGVLTSYVEVKNKGVDIINKPLILDSGAFSIATGKSKHTLDDYIKFVYEHKDKCEWYANLDVIGDADGTWANQKEMEKQGLKPIPSFHFGSDYKILNKYKEQYDFLGLGGLVPYAKQKKKLYLHLDKCFSIIKDEVKTHGWGMTGAETLRRYPFYSVDSTAWLYGGKMRKRNDYSFNSMAGCDYLAKTMDYHDLNIHNAKQYLLLIKEVTRLWQKRGIQWS